MSEEPRIRQVHQLDQSIWLDNLSRRLLVSGDLERLRDRGVAGITSNPPSSGRPSPTRRPTTRACAGWRPPAASRARSCGT